MRVIALICSIKSDSGTATTISQSRPNLSQGRLEQLALTIEGKVQDLARFNFIEVAKTCLSTAVLCLSNQDIFTVCCFESLSSTLTIV